MNYKLCTVKYAVLSLSFVEAIDNIFDVILGKKVSFIIFENLNDEFFKKWLSPNKIDCLKSK